MKVLDKIVGKDEEKFTDLFKDITSSLDKSGHKLAEAIELSTEGKDIKGVSKEIVELERKIDEIREQIENEIYKTSFLPFTRVDRLLLLEDIDSIADIAEEIVGILLIKGLPNRRIGNSIKEMSRDLEKTVESLTSLLDSLAKDIDKVLIFYTSLRLNRRGMKDKIFKIYHDVLSNSRISAIELNITLEVLRRIMVLHRKIGDVGDRGRAMVIKYF